MRKLIIGKVEEGMTLAKPLLKPDGTILLAQGCKLSARIISRLSEWGFDSVIVDGDPQSPDEMIETSGINTQNIGMDELFAQIDKQFAKVETDEIMLKLKNALKSHISKKYSENDNKREERIQEISQ